MLFTNPLSLSLSSPQCLWSLAERSNRRERRRFTTFNSSTPRNWTCRLSGRTVSTSFPNTNIVLLLIRLYSFCALIDIHLPPLDVEGIQWFFLCRSCLFVGFDLDFQKTHFFFLVRRLFFRKKKKLKFYGLFFNSWYFVVNSEVNWWMGNLGFYFLAN